MREILFRGKTKQGEWIVGNLGQHYHTKDWFIQYPNECETLKTELIILETVGQFTGLTDKNGVKIFEHDLVQIEHLCWTAKCEVKFIDGAFFFCELDNPIQNAWVRQDKFMKEEWKIKVIGNIHDDEV